MSVPATRVPRGDILRLAVAAQVFHLLLQSFHLLGQFHHPALEVFFGMGEGETWFFNMVEIWFKQKKTLLIKYDFKKYGQTWWNMWWNIWLNMVKHIVETNVKKWLKPWCWCSTDETYETHEVVQLVITLVWMELRSCQEKCCRKRRSPRFHMKNAMVMGCCGPPALCKYSFQPIQEMMGAVLIRAWKPLKLETSWNIIPLHSLPFARRRLLPLFVLGRGMAATGSQLCAGAMCQVFSNSGAHFGGSQW